MHVSTETKKDRRLKVEPTWRKERVHMRIRQLWPCGCGFCRRVCGGHDLRWIELRWYDEIERRRENGLFVVDDRDRGSDDWRKMFALGA